MPIVGVNLLMKEGSLRCGVVRQISIDGHPIDVIVLLDQIFFVTEASSSEVCRLVHVDPNTCEIDLLIQFFHLFLPENRRIWIDEICIVDLSRPYLSLIVVLITLCALQPDI
jgi:hypothetical protein